MDCGGNQGVDIIHPERSIGVCFESCKLIVDAAKWLTDAINDIHLAVAAVSGGPPAQSAPGPSTIAANFSTVQFNSCPVPSEGCPEQCDNPDDFSQGSRKGVLSSQYLEPKIPVGMLDTTPPPGTIFNVPAARNIGSNEGRLNNDLRAAASDPRHLYSLGLAAYAFAANDPKTVDLGHGVCGSKRLGPARFRRLQDRRRTQGAILSGTDQRAPTRSIGSGRFGRMRKGTGQGIPSGKFPANRPGCGNCRGEI
jgi:hypothetical protein